MSGINRVTVIGHLGRDPEMKNINGGTSLVTFSVGVTERWKKGSEWHERTEWVSVKCWGDGLGDFLMKNLKKGSKVYVEGRFSTEKWEKNGEARYSTHVVVQGGGGTVELFSAPQDRAEGARRDAGGTADQRRESRPGGGSQKASPGLDYDDEIPF